MRTLVKHGLVAVVALAAAACTKPQAPRDPIGGDPKPQAPISDPKPQALNTPIGPDSHGPQKAINDPSPQQSSFSDPTPQAPASDPQRQAPLFPADNNQNVTPAAQAAAMNLNDGQILAVASVANRGEVDMAELARKNAKSEEVKQFAAMMMTHHRDAMSKERQVQDKAKIQLEPNSVSNEIKAKSEQAMSTLREKSGTDFDRMYINSQVRIHEDVLTAIDRQLLPDASNAAVKSHLTEMRRSVASHLAKAESIQKKLDPTAAAAQKADKKDDAKAKADDKKQDTKKQDKTPDTSRSNTDQKNPNNNR